MKKTLLLLSVLIPIALHSQEYEKKSYNTVRLQDPPTIDGILDDQCWSLGEWGGNFTQYQPSEGSMVKQNTEFKILYDDRHIYVAIKAYDTAPDSIVSRMTRRDDTDGDEVMVAFDSYYDQRTAFGFGVSSAGVKGDLIWTEDGGSEDETFDPIWYVKTSVTDWGWVAEMRIPLTQLRFSADEEQVWGLEVIRTIYRYDEKDLWQPIARNASGQVHNAGLMYGIKNIKPKTLFDVTPYTVARLETYEGENGNPWYDGTDVKATVGLDAKIGVTNNMILSLTVNPDFGQVEADPSEVNLTAFETYFREKRPFFVEGKNITSFNLGIGDGDEGNDNLFYSRRIGRSPRLPYDAGSDEYTYTPAFTPILGAAKLTGKTADGWSIGAIEAVNSEVHSRVYNDITGETTHVTAEPMANYLVGRVQKDLNEGRTIIGGLITNTIRRLDDVTVDYYNKAATTAGIDFTQYFGKMNYIFQLRTTFSTIAGSEEAIARTQRSVIHNFIRPDATYKEYDPTRRSLTGTGGNLMTGKIGGNWQILYLSAWKSPEFEINDIGYMQVADQYLGAGAINYTIYKPFSIFNRMGFGMNLIHLNDFSGKLLVAGTSFSWSSHFKNFWSAYMGGQINSQQNDNNLLRGGPSMKMPAQLYLFGGLNSNERNKLVAELDLSYHKTYDDVRSSYNIGMEFTYRPVNSLTFSAEPEWNRSMNEMQYITKKTFTPESGPEETRYIFGYIDQKILSLSLRVDFNLTPDMTIQYWGQPFFGSGSYNTFKRVTDTPLADSFNDRIHIYSPSEISADGTEAYNIDENNDGITDYSFNNPNFTVSEFLHNLVFRWEFLPGSTVYLVWSQTREASASDGLFNLGDQARDLFSAEKPHNVFLVKFSYRFGLR